MLNDVEKFKSDLLDMFQSGDWCRDVTEFQTHPVLFEIQKDHWQKLRQNFIDSVINYVGYAPSSVRAWCYANLANHPQKDWPIWHTHEHSLRGHKRLLCGVLYLTHSMQGTVFLKDNQHKYLPADVGVWNFFNADEVHSPPKWDHTNQENRYCIAAEAIYV